MYEYPSIIICVRKFIRKEKNDSIYKGIFERVTIRGIYFWAFALMKITEIMKNVWKSLI